MTDPHPVAVEATEERFFALRHHPSGQGLDATGRGEWPADSFTYRLRDEGAIRLVAVAPEPAPAKGQE